MAPRACLLCGEPTRSSVMDGGIELPCCHTCWRLSDGKPIRVIAAEATERVAS